MADDENGDAIWILLREIYNFIYLQTDSKQEPMQGTCTKPFPISAVSGTRNPETESVTQCRISEHRVQMNRNPRAIAKVAETHFPQKISCLQ